YPLAVLGVGGAVILRRRRVPIFPLVAMAADVVIVTLLTYGNTRFRATLEPILVLLAAVTVDAAVRWVEARRSAPSAVAGWSGSWPGPPGPVEPSDPRSGSEPAPAHRT